MSARQAGRVVPLFLLTALGLLLALYWALPLFKAPAQAQSQTILFNQQFKRTKGRPNLFIDTFTVPTNIGPPFQLHIDNGLEDRRRRISSATLTLNGVEVVHPSEFSKRVATIDKEVDLQTGTNTLEVRLTSKPGALITVTITGTGTIPPSLDTVTTDTGTAGQSLTVTLTGSFTSFQDDVTEARFGPNIGVDGSPEGAFGGVAVQDEVTATANVTISQAAALGPRTVTVRTGTEEVSKIEAFTVLAPGPVAIGETTVTTVAGSDTPGFADGQGTAAQFDGPRGIARDAGGNLYVADTNNHSIRKIAPDGRVTTLAGSGTPGFTDDEGTDAQFNSPEGVTAAADGTVYVADTANHAIRQILNDGTVSTLAGTGNADFQDGTGSGAKFDTPRSIALRPDGLLVVGDEGNNRVRLVDPATGAVSTLAGSGIPGYQDGQPDQARFASLAGVAADADNVFVADTDNQRIRKILPNGTVSTFAGIGAFGFADGPALNAQFADPSGVTVDAAGNVYVADTFNSLIRRVTPGGQVETVAGTGVRGADDGPGTAATFRTPQALVTGSDVFIADTGNHLIRQLLTVPVIAGIDPTTGVQGTTLTLTVTGMNLGGATALTFLNGGTADTDITATNLSVDPSGTTLTASVTIASTAALGVRVVTVTTPAGTSSDTATGGNTFTVEGKITLTPASQTLQVGQDGDSTVTLSGPAGSGGVSVTLTSAATGIATVSSPVNIPAGATTGTATVTGVAPGITNILATAPGYQSGTAGVEVVGNRPPVLDPIGDQTAPLGQTLSFTVTGSDPDGDALIFGVTPLPLPPNMSFDSQVGLFTFTPAADQVGTFALTFAASDGQDTSSVSVTITVPGAPPGGVTAFSGRILDANDFEINITTPVVGATVSFLGTGQTAVTDAQGFFTVSNIPAGQQILDIDPATANAAPDGSTYAGFREQAELIANVTNVVERPFFLPRIDATSLTTVNPGATTVVTNPNLGVTLTIPSNTAKDASGNNFTGQLSTSLVPRDLAPAALPEELDPGLLITIQPVGVTFVTPVPITFPNIDNLPPGSELDLWSLDANTGTFVIVGTMQVSADGTQLTTISGGIRAADWHAPLSPQPTGDNAENNEADDDCRCQVPQGSTAAVRGGELGVTHTLAGVRSLGVSHPLTLRYTSTHADPRPIIVSDATILQRAAVPKTASLKLRVGGVDQPGELFTDTTGLSESVDETLRQAVQLDGIALPTGRYPYRLTLTSNYLSSSISTFLNGQVIVNNRRSSPFGAGWSLEGLQRTHVQSDDSLLLEEGNGSAKIFAKGTAIQVQTFATGLSTPIFLAFDTQGNLFVSNFSTSTVSKITPDGTVTTFATGFTSPAGLAFDTSGNLYVANFGVIQGAAGNTISKVSPEGVVTTFATGVGHATGLAFDVAGNLYVSELGGDGSGTTIFKVSPTGAVSTFATGLSGPAGLAFDGSGNLFVANFGFAGGNNSVSKVTPEGVVSTFATGFASPFGLAFDGAGNLFVSNSGFAGGGGTVSRVTAGGVVTTFASGFDGPFGVAFDAVGDLFVANSGFTGGQLGGGTTVSKVLIGKDFAPPPGDFSTLVRNADDTFTRTLKDGTKINFDANGLQTSVVDRNGNTTSYAYNPDGTLASITDPAGLVTTFSYTGGTLSSITDPTGRVSQLTVDGNGDLTEITDPDGAVTSYAYDGQHLLTSQSNPLNVVTSYQYDFAGRLRQTSLPDGSTRLLSPNITVGVIDPASGQGTETTPAPVVRPTAAVSTSTDGNGNATTFRTDQFGAAIEQTDGLGRTTLIERDANSNPTKITRPNGSVVTLTYDARGNLLTTTEQAIGATTTFTYEPTFNQVTSITDPQGNTTTLTYDANGNPTQIADALNNSTTLAYDSRGLLTSVTDALGNVTTFGYNAQGNLISTTDPLGNVTSLSYDGAGNVISSTDALGRVTSFAYDPMSRLTQVTDAGGGVTQYGYDAKGNLINVTDAKGQTTTFAYNEVDQLAQTTNPLGQAKTFSYDLARNLLLVVDAKGQQIEFTYDAANQLVQKVLKDAVGTIMDTVAFTYDSLGSLATATDSDSGLTFTYDALSRLTQAQTAATVVQPATAITYTYNKNGNRLTMTDPQAAVTNYVYDALNRLTSLTSPQGTSSFTYDALSRRTGLTLPNGATAAYTYDEASQLTELLNTIGVTTISRFAYTYDAASNRITRTTTNGIANYDYDALNRLTDATQPDPVDPLQQLTEAFQYDPVGNRTSSHLATGQVHDVANRLLEDSNFTFSYDANGNLIEKIDKANGDRTVYTYDVENQLVQVEKFTVAGGLSPVVSAIYRYDALGRRIEKDVSGIMTLTTRYIFDNEDILLELDGNNQVVARYTHGPGIDEPVIMLRGGQPSFYHADGLGSVWDLTDFAGSAVRSYTYDSFGNLLSNTGSVTNPYTYTGREFDTESGLYYYRARYYDPNVGRFLQGDPLGLPGVPINGYAYTQNNPTNLTDPSGFIANKAAVNAGGSTQQRRASPLAGWDPNLFSPVMSLSSSLNPERSGAGQSCPVVVAAEGGVGSGGAAARGIGKPLAIGDIARVLLEGGQAEAQAMLHLLRADFRMFQQSGMHRYKAFENIEWDRFDTTGKFEDALQNALRESGQ
ncbi:MAG: hypothetical protein O7D33_05215 [Chloroflexi bacterium]|nr:hypothetical protein [Chloroflexota bacterium]